MLCDRRNSQLIQEGRSERTKGSAGWIFEKFVHIRLTSAFTTPLTCVPTNDATATLTIPVCAITRLPNGKTGLSKANKYTPLFYWRPTSSSFTSINSIICTDSDIILAQAAVASQHDVKVLGLDAIRDGLPTKFCQERDWCIVFITPMEESARSLRNQNAILPER